MARPIKQTIDWFPHYCIHKSTMYVLEQRHGNDGYAFWFKLLEILGSTDGHYIDTNDEIVWEFLQAKTRLSTVDCEAILNLLCKMKAIDPELWSKRVIWSPNFIENISEAYKNRKRPIPQKPSHFTFLRVETEFLPVETQLSPVDYDQPTTENRQSRVEKSNNPPTPLSEKRGSESEKISSKEKQSTDTSTNLEQLPVIEKQLKPTRGMTTKLQILFDRFWLAYPKRIAKAVAATAWVKIAPDDQLAAVIIAAIDQAKNADAWKLEGGRFIPNPATWLNGQCWLDEHQVSTSSLPTAVMPKRTYVDATVDLYADSRQNRTPEGLVPTPYSQSPAGP